MSEVLDQQLLLVSGIPATGKSSVCRFLQREFGFAHYDMECHPRGWPIPELKVLWDMSRPAFVEALRASHANIVIDWGFPPTCIKIVDELQALGGRLIWLTGDIQHARRLFIERGGLDVKLFDVQLQKITEAGYPTGLSCLVVAGLTPDGNLRNPAETAREILSG